MFFDVFASSRVSTNPAGDAGGFIVTVALFIAFPVTSTMFVPVIAPVVGVASVPAAPEACAFASCGVTKSTPANSSTVIVRRVSDALKVAVNVVPAETFDVQTPTTAPIEQFPAAFAVPVTVPHVIPVTAAIDWKTGVPPVETIRTMTLPEVIVDAFVPTTVVPPTANLTAICCWT